MSDGNSGVDTYDENPWDTGNNFNEKYQERHGEIVECMDSKHPLIDATKPILKRNKETSSSEENIIDTRTSEACTKYGIADMMSDCHPSCLQNENSDLYSSENDIKFGGLYTQEEKIENKSLSPNIMGDHNTSQDSYSRKE